VICITQNEGINSITFPSNNPQTIAVGAINRTTSRASFSNYGTGIDVVAPGVSIRTTDRQGTLGYNETAGALGDYTSLDGTSFAAPQVAGVAALILSVNPGLTQQQVRNIIESTADKVGNYSYTMNAGEQTGLTWNNQMGYGRLNAQAAVQAALPTITGTSLVCTTYSTFNLNNPPPGSTVTWSRSSNLTLDSSNNTSAAVRAINSTVSGNGWVRATITGDCGSFDVQEDFWVARPATPMIYGPQTTVTGSLNYYTANNTSQSPPFTE